jgi:hypothetical protein
MRKPLLFLLVAIALLCSCKNDVEPSETGASYVRTVDGNSEVWYFDNSEEGLFEHYLLQGSVKVPKDNGWWKMEGGSLSLTCRGVWSMYSAPTAKGIRLDVNGNTFEMKSGGEDFWQYSDGFLTCTLSITRGETNTFILVISDSWHNETYRGTCEQFKGIDTVYTADSKAVVHINVTKNDNMLEIDGNRYSRM